MKPGKWWRVEYRHGRVTQSISHADDEMWDDRPVVANYDALSFHSFPTNLYPLDTSVPSRRIQIELYPDLKR